MSEFSDLSTSDNSRKTSNGLPNMIQLKLDEVNRVMKALELPRNPKTQSEDASPLRFYDDLYAYRTSTKWPPITGKWPTESPNRIIIADFEKKLDHAIDNFKNKLNNQQERVNYYNNDFAKRIKKIDLTSKISSMKLPDVHLHTHERPSDVLVTIGCGVGIIFLLFLIIFSARKKKRTQPGTVLSTGRVLEPGAVQRNQEIPMRSPGQGGTVPPNIGMPYSNKTFNEEPPPYPGDTVPLVNNNGFVEMGFLNECVAMPTAPNDLKTGFVTDNGKTVESLNVGMQKNQAGQGFKPAEDKDSVKIQDHFDEADRLVKEMNFAFNPEKKTEKYPSASWKDDLNIEKYPPWNDDLYVHRTTTKWPPLDWHPMTPYTERTDSFLEEFNKKWDQEHTQVVKPHHRHTSTYVWVPLISLLPVVVILLVMLAIYLARRKNKRTSAAAVLPNGRVIGPGPVQRNQQIPMMPPEQGGAVPPNVPYSDNFNRPYNDDPPPYPTDADLQVHNNDSVGIGFRNQIATVPSAPPPNPDYGEPVESLNFELNKKKAGQGTHE